MDRGALKVIRSENTQDEVISTREITTLHDLDVRAEKLIVYVIIHIVLIIFNLPVTSSRYRGINLADLPARARHEERGIRCCKNDSCDERKLSESQTDVTSPRERNVACHPRRVAHPDACGYNASSVSCVVVCFERSVPLSRDFIPFPRVSNNDALCCVEREQAERETNNRNPRTAYRSVP